MAASKKSLKWILIVVIIVVIAAIIYYFVTKDPKVEKPKENVPAGSGSTSWVDESFPLNVGMFGEKIKALQIALGISTDGKFGNQTKGSIEAKGYTVPLSESDYKKIIANPTASSQTGGSGKTIDDFKGKWIKAKYDNTIVRYIDGQIFKTYSAGQDIGRIGDTTAIGPYHKLIDVAGDDSILGLKIHNSYLNQILGL